MSKLSLSLPSQSRYLHGLSVWSVIRRLRTPSPSRTFFFQRSPQRWSSRCVLSFVGLTVFQTGWRQPRLQYCNIFEINSIKSIACNTLYYYMAELAIRFARKMAHTDWLPSRAISFSYRPTSFGGKIFKQISRQTNHIHAGTFNKRFITRNKEKSS